MGAWSNCRPNKPQVFVNIEKNYAARTAIKAQEVVSWSDVKLFKELKRDMDVSLRPGAELLLRWNTDKGNTAK